MSVLSLPAADQARSLAVTPENLGAAPAPRGRASWSGLMRLSLVAVPVKAYPATSPAKSLTSTNFTPAAANASVMKNIAPSMAKSKRAPSSAATRSPQTNTWCWTRPTWTSFGPPKTRPWCWNGSWTPGSWTRLCFPAAPCIYCPTVRPLTSPTWCWSRPCRNGTNGLWAEWSSPATASWPWSVSAAAC